MGGKTKMAMNNVLHMNAGDGETSYANNSGFQKAVMSKSLPVLDETLKDMLNDGLGFSKCLKIVDFGCASGPNTLLAMSHIMDKIKDLCRENNINDHLPEFEVFLNDLPENDFNNLFKLLPQEYGRKNCFVYGLPGSFYGRLLPNKSIHFAYSCYSIHWLSQVPEGLEKKNKENIYMSITSPPEVYEAYAKQYQRDFSTFLSLRAAEIISGGRMVLTFISRSAEDASTSHDDYASYTLLAKVLLDMVSEGLVNKDDLYSFNVPIYTPHTKEVEAAIQTEGSFSLEKMDVSRVSWDASDEDQLIFDEHKKVKAAAARVRAFMEPMLASHFGSSVLDELFTRCGKLVVQHQSDHKSSCINIVVSLKRI